MLRKIRITLAIICFSLITLLFLDFTGTMQIRFGWLANIQFLPAVLALNLGIVILLLVLTFLLGRVYCSVLCPLGVFQDIVSRISGMRKKKKFRFSYSPAVKWLRYVIFGFFIIALVAGVGSVFALLDPYGSYGRIAQSLFSPLWGWGNNLLAFVAEKNNNSTFQVTDVWLKSIPTLFIASITFIVLVILAWKNGRTYCNTVCPIGTLLGFLSQYSLFRITIDSQKCNKCSLCSRSCKASCIDYKNHNVDNSRCVTCMNCLQRCNRKAISYKLNYPQSNTYPQSENKNNQPEESVNESRRNFLSLSALLVTVSLLKSTEKVSDGMVIVSGKKIVERSNALVPAGSLGIEHFTTHCIACQLCVSACPSQVLRPSDNLSRLMQPEMSYKRGYCNPECTKCSEVCPAEAITKISSKDKLTIQVGHAVSVPQNCKALTENKECDVCAKNCPLGAIIMISSDSKRSDSPKIPFVLTERCIGCGTCENLCPAKPISGIYVEGNKRHITI